MSAEQKCLALCGSYHLGVATEIDTPAFRVGNSGEGSHKGHHHYVSHALVAGIEGNKVRLSANADVAVSFEEEK